MELPLRKKPPLRSVLDIAIPLDILETHQLLGEEYLYYYWQLQLQAATGWPLLLPRIEWHNSYYFLSQDMDATSSELIRDIQSALHDGFYVFGMFNERFIPHTYSYDTADFLHGSLIYGYEKDTDVFRSTAQVGRYYTENDIPFDHLRRAVDFPGVVLAAVKPLRNREPLPFDRSHLLYFITAYLHSFDGMRLDQRNWYGLRAMEHFYEEFSLERPSLLTSLYVLYEHKKVMYDRLLFLVKDMADAAEMMNNVEAYQKAVTACRTAVNLWIKHSVAFSDKTADRIKRQLFDAITVEEECLGTLVDRLKPCVADEKKPPF